LLLHVEHAGEAHRRNRNSITGARVITERPGRKYPIRPPALNRKPSIRLLVEVGSAERHAIPLELARLLGRLSHRDCRAGSYEGYRRPLVLATLNPELDIAVLTRDAADPGVKTPTTKQPCSDSSSAQRVDHGANHP
jgi:hypothetical protein